MKRPLLLLGLVGPACTHADPATTRAPVAVASSEAGATVGVAPSVPAPDAGPPAPLSKWRTPMAGDGPLYVAIDGLCSELTVYAAGSRAFVTYGGTGWSFMYRKPDNVREGRGTLALLGETLITEGAPNVDNIISAAGAESGAAWAVEDSSGRSDITRQVHRYLPGKGWSTTHASDGVKYENEFAGVEAMRPWVGGSLLALRTGAAPHFITDGPPDSIPPDSVFPTNHDFGSPYSGSATHPASGTAVVVINVKDDAYKFRVAVWSKGSAPRFFVLATDEKDVGPTSVAVIAPDDIYLARGSSLGHFDGKAWKLVASKGDPVKTFLPNPAGGVFAHRENGRLTTVDAALKETNLPTPDKVETMAVGSGRVLITTAAGNLYESKNGAFERIAIPPPAFGRAKEMKVRDVKVGTDGTVYAIAKYWEKGIGWSESELHWTVLTSRKVDETHRCNEPDPENNNAKIGHGYQSWPPKADASCKEPFVVVARKSKVNPSDWKATVQRLAGEGISFVELTSGDRTYLGAKVATVELGEALAKKAVQGTRLRPEVVCGVPDASTAVESPVKSVVDRPR